jgi:hypothetical protein
LAQAIMPAAGLDHDTGDRDRAPLGSFVRTGEVCPANGWWRCQETHALDGTRWFARGTLLPAATFQVPVGVFAKSSGPEHIQRRSMWQLVRLAEATASAPEPRTGAEATLVAVPPTLV